MSRSSTCKNKLICKIVKKDSSSYQKCVFLFIQRPTHIFSQIFSFCSESFLFKRLGYLFKIFSKFPNAFYQKQTKPKNLSFFYRNFSSPFEQDHYAKIEVCHSIQIQISRMSKQQKKFSYLRFRWLFYSSVDQSCL